MYWLPRDVAFEKHVINITIQSPLFVHGDGRGAGGGGGYMYRVPHFGLSVFYGRVSWQLIWLRGFVAVCGLHACSRETHVSVDCAVFNSPALWCSAPVAIEDRYKFQPLICACLVLRKNRKAFSTPGLAETRWEDKKCDPGTATSLLLTAIITVSLSSEEAFFGQGSCSHMSVMQL